MANILNEKLIELIHALGEEIKNDPRADALKTAAAAYNDSNELHTMITEYNVHQQAMSAEYAKEERDEDVIRSIEKRLEELYDQITALPTYAEYARAKEDYDEFYNEIVSELEYTVTGQRPCAHDCSSCGGCH